MQHRCTAKIFIAIGIAILLAGAVLPNTLSWADYPKEYAIPTNQQAPPVTADIGVPAYNLGSTLKPMTSQSGIIQYNLFLPLTMIDPYTNQLAPLLARTWQSSPDGLTWIFYLSEEVYWYRYDPATQQATKLRPVVAADVVFGVQRWCDPRFSPNGFIIRRFVVGCDLVASTSDDQVTDKLVHGPTIGVTAIDTHSIEFQLTRPAEFFPTMGYYLTALPQLEIQANPTTWADFGAIVTNGPYFVHEYVPNVSAMLVRNQAFPTALRMGGNVDVVNLTAYNTYIDIYLAYLANAVDTAGVSPADLQYVLNHPIYASETHPRFEPVTIFFAYAHEKPPFDNVHVRRAFSAIVDREELIEQYLDGYGLPMIHFTAPGIPFAPPIGEIGVGFDPTYAQNEIAAAGFPNCEGLPPIEIFTLSPDAGIAVAQALAARAETYLGCDPDLFTVNQGGDLDFLNDLEGYRPNIWLIGWGPDYLDADNYVGDYLGCINSHGSGLERPCTELDELIEQASVEQDPEVRQVLYTQIEEGFFGPDGEYPIIPLFVRISYTLAKPWYSGPFDTFVWGLGLFYWDYHSIDMAAKLAALAP
ncbi:MAG: hypothetical protein BroJett018_36340 [Chloroflexota bacterium]|nr:hypothetical protein [Chloroflexota bacterium]NOG64106.1 hypothetical protein [Chloroflexota bacterium]GIK65840.1 MAG: hypothetical protein BroJett018_36340 [Chloroflexota bacterium]